MLDLVTLVTCYNLYPNKDFFLIKQILENYFDMINRIQDLILISTHHGGDKWLVVQMLSHAEHNKITGLPFGKWDYLQTDVLELESEMKNRLFFWCFFLLTCRIISSFDPTFRLRAWHDGSLRSKLESSCYAWLYASWSIFHCLMTLSKLIRMYISRISFRIPWRIRKKCLMNKISLGKVFN
jgi:hypothetical protein